MDVQLFHTFDAVATHGSVSKAAAALGYSQPAVTHQVQRLEHLLRARLFDRCAGGVTLTSAGERLLPLARTVLSVLGQMQADIEPDASPGKAGDSGGRRSPDR
ncbi:molybdate transport repressor ModE-like protein [Humibacillus xanthopallidus]|uniref:Molybdate transport repressor ModE-like protein n=1 Tax=Humibacillus xanthopallidus TaxID=412689 RepID=A0A543PRF3_9MICO|nr:LysR family transcriptional regulator [Humibacillus xanthopallidus]TQN46645.1 molybdate transport repressor ModE-like protein [Humibacillus xanthopallidus]